MRTSILVLLALAISASVDCRNDVPPIQPEPGLPCGRTYVYCPATGGCCHADDEVCGQEGHACGLGDCCYVGGPGPTWGAHPPRKQLTPEQVRRIELGGRI